MVALIKKGVFKILILVELHKCFTVKNSMIYPHTLDLDLLVFHLLFILDKCCFPFL